MGGKKEMKKIFLVRFNRNRMYINSYKQLFKSDLKIISGFLSMFKILFLPLKAKVIIEDIHIYWYLYIIRFDLIIIHILEAVVPSRLAGKIQILH